MAESPEIAAELPLTGGCGCGSVRWTLSVPPVASHYCHCKRCQRRSGSAASINAMTAPGAFTLTSGKEALKAWKPGDGWHKYYCGECGSAVFSCAPDDFDHISLRMGGFDADPGIRPSFHQFTEYAPAWGPVPDDGLPRFPERRPSSISASSDPIDRP